MKAVLASLGTSGDFEPMLALAIGLRNRGHRPVLANSPDFAERARKNGIPFLPVGPPLARLGLTKCLETILALASPLEQAAAMLGCIVPFVPQMVDELDTACADADVLVCLPFQVAGYMSHERTGIPYVAWSFSPFGEMAGMQLAQATREMINASRLKVGLPARLEPFADATGRSRLALFATSSHVFRRPRRWPAHYHLTGYFFVDEPWQPDANLSRFLETGPPPIVVTFGSMRHPDSTGMSRLVLEAIERIGCRAIVQSGWSGLSEITHSPTVHHATGFIPHGWLFQHAACIVHHGAAGTTAAALRAGVRSVIVPHALDQSLWAALMQGCGAATSVIPLAQLSVERLAAAIDDALSSGSDGRLSRLSAHIRDEDGIGCAIELLEHQ
jgi:sterol 3beta-glucosyltransferase